MVDDDRGNDFGSRARGSCFFNRTMFCVLNTEIKLYDHRYSRLDARLLYVRGSFTIPSITVVVKDLETEHWWAPQGTSLETCTALLMASQKLRRESQKIAIII